MEWKKRRPINMSYKASTWQIWQRASELLPEPQYTTETNEATEYYLGMVAKKCIDLVFNSDVTLENLREEVNEYKTAKRAVRKNARLWKPRAGKLPKPMSDEDLAYQAKHPYWPTWNENSEQTGEGLMPNTY
jgi:hypothetical protein